MSVLKGKIGDFRKEIASLDRLKPVYLYTFGLFRDTKTSHQIMMLEIALRKSIKSSFHIRSSMGFAYL